MKKFTSEAMQVIYEAMEDFYKMGIITAEQFYEFDDCLVPEPACVKPSRVPVLQYANPVT